MSSTNRGYERHKTDYYVTPLSPIKDFLSEFLLDCEDEEIEGWYSISQRPDRLLWLDPCAGGDTSHPMSYPTVLEDTFGVTPETIDIRPDSLAETKADYLTTKLKYKPNIIITNPPFYLAKEIIIKALEDVAENGFVIMLLRLNFFGSKERKKFFEKYMPIRAYVHSRRFSFTNGKKTDSIEYMHAVWQKGNYPEYTKIKII